MALLEDDLSVTSCEKSLVEKITLNMYLCVCFQPALPVAK